MKRPLLIPHVLVEWLRFHCPPPSRASRVEITSPDAAASDDWRNRLSQRERGLFAVASWQCNGAAGSHRPADSGGDAVTGRRETRHVVGRRVYQGLSSDGMGDSAVWSEKSFLETRS